MIKTEAKMKVLRNWLFEHSFLHHKHGRGFFIASYGHAELKHVQEDMTAKKIEYNELQIKHRNLKDAEGGEG